MLAFGFNDYANGVGRHSTTELRLLSVYPKFTAAVLYNRILCRIQNWMSIGRELHKAPLHIVLTQNPVLPSSIQLSVKPRPVISLHSPPQGVGSASSTSLSSNQMTDSGQESSSSSISGLLSIEQQLPRILLTVRLKENLSADLSADLFAEWLGMMPIIAESVTVEAGFGSFSTLIFVSIPTPMWVCLGKDVAINLAGIMRGRINIKASIYSDKERNEHLQTNLALNEVIHMLQDRVKSVELENQGLRNYLSESNLEKCELRRERQNCQQTIEILKRENLKEKREGKEGGLEDSRLPNRLSNPSSEEDVKSPPKIERISLQRVYYPKTY
ncbi:hypothetical protein NHQ30_008129 [Ciborinia camelliae]|nr:hypothetical protein NHQ30_008129 [Ciborinia camelliae]